MSSYCPDWIFNLSCGMIATEFISKNITLPALTHKYVDAIAKDYIKIEPITMDAPIENCRDMLNPKRKTETTHVMIIARDVADAKWGLNARKNCWKLANTPHPIRSNQI